MDTFRKVIFWLHLTAGVLGGIVIFIMCVTGAALAFEKKIIELVERDARTVEARSERAPISRLLESAVAAKSNVVPSAILVTNDPSTAVAVSLGREGQIFVDPYTAQITGESSAQTRAFFAFVTDLHRWIALSGDGRPVGKAITGACNLMFLFLALSGIYIWFPRRLAWSTMKPNLWFRRTSTGRARDFNWHNTIGFWSSLVLIVLTVTAAVISYQWASNLIFTLTGNEPPAQQQQQRPAEEKPELPYKVPTNIDDLWSTAANHTDWKSISLRLPLTKSAVFTIDEGKSWNIFGRSTLTVEAETAAVSKWEPYAERNSAQQIRSWFRFMHTGESFGLPGQIIGFIACIGGAFLVFTGLSLAVRRLGGYVRGRRRLRSAAGA
jgi:uncharacterized iron-regulated membrane protein